MCLKILFSLLAVLSLAGCATTKKDSVTAQVQQLRSEISDLETQLKQRDGEIEGLEKELDRAQSAKSAPAKTFAGDAGKVSSKQIQNALKNAGFYEGRIDGKIGKNTKQAVRAFQEANGLAADGVVGNKTWAKLSAYLQ